MNLKDLTDKELFVFGAEANATGDQNLLNEITDELKLRNKRHKCHNYQPACEHKDCNTCEDWWYNEAEHGRFAEKGR